MKQEQKKNPSIFCNLVLSLAFYVPYHQSQKFLTEESPPLLFLGFSAAKNSLYSVSLPGCEEGLVCSLLLNHSGLWFTPWMLTEHLLSLCSSPQARGQHSTAGACVCVFMSSFHACVSLHVLWFINWMCVYSFYNMCFCSVQKRHLSLPLMVI